MPLQEGRDLCLGLCPGRRARQLAGQIVERVGVCFAALRIVRLFAQACGQVRRDNGGHQHHDQGDEVLKIVDGKREARWHVKEVERAHAQDDSEDRRVASQVDCHHEHRQQEDHGKVRCRDLAIKCLSD